MARYVRKTTRNQGTEFPPEKSPDLGDHDSSG
jgi:hypothetical protein